MTAVRVAGALVVLLWSLAGASYALLAYTPFTKIQFLDSNVIPATSLLARWHGACAWVALGAALVVLVPVVKRPTLWAVAGVGAVAASSLTLWPVLPGLQSEMRTLIWGAVWLLPSIALSVVLVRQRLAAPIGSEAPAAPHALAMAAVLAAAVCWLAGLSVAALRVPLAGSGLLPGASLAAHVVLFGVAASVLILALTGCATRATRSLVMLALVTALVASVLYAWVFRGVNFTGIEAMAAALIMAVTLTLGWPLVRVRSGRAALVLLLVLAAASVGVQMGIARLDWNFLGQRLASMGVWAGAFALATVVVARVPPRRWIVPLVVGVVLVLAGLLRVAQARVDPSRADDWSSVDPSFAAITELVPMRRTGADTAIFTFLQEHTGLPRASDIAPYDVTFAASLTPPLALPPHIFIIVIDSLRQDYLGAYDPTIAFTPSFDRFAADSLVFRRAFSRYGATGLAQPSLWVGGIMPHKQYIQPFAPMNALEKLLRANRYDVRMSYDIISRQILLPTTVAVDLDAGVQNMDYRLCSTLTAVTEGLPQRSDRPLFVSTMPQDIHVSTLSREGNRAIDSEDYGEKFAPYASRVRRMDACFGTFIDSLKAIGLYDESVIIVTADHGDSLGERGRWGHAYTMFPEILRVPLIIKLPQAAQAPWESRVNDVAFTTDITPTLYRLLGYDVASDDRFFGVPLIAAAGDTRVRTPRHLAVSSYGPVYAVFDHNGESLYILDAVNYRDHLFRLGGRPSEDREVVANADEQAEYRGFLRTRLTELHALYGITR